MRAKAWWRYSDVVQPAHPLPLLLCWCRSVLLLLLLVAAVVWWTAGCRIRFLLLVLPAVVERQS